MRFASLLAVVAQRKGLIVVVLRRSSTDDEKALNSALQCEPATLGAKEFLLLADACIPCRGAEPNKRTVRETTTTLMRLQEEALASGNEQLCRLKHQEAEHLVVLEYYRGDAMRRRGEWFTALLQANIMYVPRHERQEVELRAYEQSRETPARKLDDSSIWRKGQPCGSTPKHAADKMPKKLIINDEAKVPSAKASKPARKQKLELKVSCLAPAHRVQNESTTQTRVMEKEEQDAETAKVPSTKAFEPSSLAEPEPKDSRPMPANCAQIEDKTHRAGEAALQENTEAATKSLEAEVKPLIPIRLAPPPADSSQPLVALLGDEDGANFVAPLAALGGKDSKNTSANPGKKKVPKQARPCPSFRQEPATEEEWRSLWARAVEAYLHVAWKDFLHTFQTWLVINDCRDRPAVNNLLLLGAELHAKDGQLACEVYPRLKKHVKNYERAQARPDQDETFNEGHAGRLLAHIFAACGHPVPEAAEQNSALLDMMTSISNKVLSALGREALVKPKIQRHPSLGPAAPPPGMPPTAVVPAPPLEPALPSADAPLPPSNPSPPASEPTGNAQLELAESTPHLSQPSSQLAPARASMTRRLAFHWVPVEDGEDAQGRADGDWVTRKQLALAGIVICDLGATTSEGKTTVTIGNTTTFRYFQDRLQTHLGTDAFRIHYAGHIMAPIDQDVFITELKVWEASTLYISRYRARLTASALEEVPSAEDEMAEERPGASSEDMMDVGDAIAEPTEAATEQAAPPHASAAAAALLNLAAHKENVGEASEPPMPTLTPTAPLMQSLTTLISACAARIGVDSLDADTAPTRVLPEAREPAFPTTYKLGPRKLFDVNAVGQLAWYVGDGSPDTITADLCVYNPNRLTHLHFKPYNCDKLLATCYRTAYKTGALRVASEIGTLQHDEQGYRGSSVPPITRDNLVLLALRQEVHVFAVAMLRVESNTRDAYLVNILALHQAVHMDTLCNNLAESSLDATLHFRPVANTNSTALAQLMLEAAHQYFNSEYRLHVVAVASPRGQYGHFEKEPISAELSDTMFVTISGAQQRALTPKEIEEVWMSAARNENTQGQIVRADDTVFSLRLASPMLHDSTAYTPLDEPTLPGLIRQWCRADRIVTCAEKGAETGSIARMLARLPVAQCLTFRIVPVPDSAPGGNSLSYRKTAFQRFKFLGRSGTELKEEELAFKLSYGYHETLLSHDVFNPQTPARRYPLQDYWCQELKEKGNLWIEVSRDNQAAIKTICSRKQLPPRTHAPPENNVMRTELDYDSISYDDNDRLHEDNLAAGGRAEKEAQAAARRAIEAGAEKAHNERGGHPTDQPSQGLGGEDPSLHPGLTPEGVSFLKLTADFVASTRSSVVAAPLPELNGLMPFLLPNSLYKPVQPWVDEDLTTVQKERAELHKLMDALQTIMRACCQHIMSERQRHKELGGQHEHLRQQYEQRLADVMKKHRLELQALAGVGNQIRREEAAAHKQQLKALGPHEPSSKRHQGNVSDDNYHHTTHPPARHSSEGRPHASPQPRGPNVGSATTASASTVGHDHHATLQPSPPGREQAQQGTDYAHGGPQWRDVGEAQRQRPAPIVEQSQQPQASEPHQPSTRERISNAVVSTPARSPTLVSLINLSTELYLRQRKRYHESKVSDPMEASRLTEADTPSEINFITPDHREARSRSIKLGRVRMKSAALDKKACLAALEVAAKQYNDENASLAELHPKWQTSDPRTYFILVLESYVTSPGTRFHAPQYCLHICFHPEVHNAFVLQFALKLHSQGLDDAVMTIQPKSISLRHAGAVDQPDARWWYELRQHKLAFGSDEARKDYQAHQKDRRQPNQNPLGFGRGRGEGMDSRPGDRGTDDDGASGRAAQHNSVLPLAADPDGSRKRCRRQRIEDSSDEGSDEEAKTATYQTVEVGEGAGPSQSNEAGGNSQEAAIDLDTSATVTDEHRLHPQGDASVRTEVDGTADASSVSSRRSLLDFLMNGPKLGCSFAGRRMAYVPIEPPPQRQPLPKFVDSAAENTCFTAAVLAQYHQHGLDNTPGLALCHDALTRAGLAEYIGRYLPQPQMTQLLDSLGIGGAWLDVDRKLLFLYYPPGVTQFATVHVENGNHCEPLPSHVGPESQFHSLQLCPLSDVLFSVEQHGSRIATDSSGQVLRATGLQVSSLGAETISCLPADISAMRARVRHFARIASGALKAARTTAARLPIQIRAGATTVATAPVCLDGTVGEKGDELARGHAVALNDGVALSHIAEPSASLPPSPPPDEAGRLFDVVSKRSKAKEIPPPAEVGRLLDVVSKRPIAQEIFAGTSLPPSPPSSPPPTLITSEGVGAKWHEHASLISFPEVQPPALGGFDTRVNNDAVYGDARFKGAAIMVLRLQGISEAGEITAELSFIASNAFMSAMLPTCLPHFTNDLAQYPPGGTYDHGRGTLLEAMVAKIALDLGYEQAEEVIQDLILLLMQQRMTPPASSKQPIAVPALGQGKTAIVLLNELAQAEGLKVKVSCPNPQEPQKCVTLTLEVHSVAKTPALVGKYSSGSDTSISRAKAKAAANLMQAIAQDSSGASSSSSYAMGDLAGSATAVKRVMHVQTKSVTNPLQPFYLAKNGATHFLREGESAMDRAKRASFDAHSINVMQELFPASIAHIFLYDWLQPPLLAAPSTPWQPERRGVTPRLILPGHDPLVLTPKETTVVHVVAIGLPADKLAGPERDLISWELPSSLISQQVTVSLSTKDVTRQLPLCRQRLALQDKETITLVAAITNDSTSNVTLGVGTTMLWWEAGKDAVSPRHDSYGATLVVVPKIYDSTGVRLPKMFQLAKLHPSATQARKAVVTEAREFILAIGAQQQQLYDRLTSSDAQWFPLTHDKWVCGHHLFVQDAREIATRIGAAEPPLTNEELVSALRENGELRNATLATFCALYTHIGLDLCALYAQDLKLLGAFYPTNYVDHLSSLGADALELLGNLRIPHVRPEQREGAPSTWLITRSGGDEALHADRIIMDFSKTPWIIPSAHGSAKATRMLPDVYALFEKPPGYHEPNSSFWISQLLAFPVGMPRRKMPVAIRSRDDSEGSAERVWHGVTMVSDSDLANTPRRNVVLPRVTMVSDSDLANTPRRNVDLDHGHAGPPPGQAGTSTGAEDGPLRSSRRSCRGGERAQHRNEPVLQQQPPRKKPPLGPLIVRLPQHPEHYSFLEQYRFYPMRADRRPYPSFPTPLDAPSHITCSRSRSIQHYSRHRPASRPPSSDNITGLSANHGTAEPQTQYRRQHRLLQQMRGVSFRTEEPLWYALRPLKKEAALAWPGAISECWTEESFSGPSLVYCGLQELTNAMLAGCVLAEAGEWLHDREDIAIFIPCAQITPTRAVFRQQNPSVPTTPLNPLQRTDEFWRGLVEVQRSNVDEVQPGMRKLSNGDKVQPGMGYMSRDGVDMVATEVITYLRIRKLLPALGPAPDGLTRDTALPIFLSWCNRTLWCTTSMEMLPPASWQATSEHSPAELPLLTALAPRHSQAFMNNFVARRGHHPLSLHVHQNPAEMRAVCWELLNDNRSYADAAEDTFHGFCLCCYHTQVYGDRERPVVDFIVEQMDREDAYDIDWHSGCLSGTASCLCCGEETILPAVSLPKDPADLARVLDNCCSYVLGAPMDIRTLNGDPFTIAWTVRLRYQPVVPDRYRPHSESFARFVKRASVRSEANVEQGCIIYHRWHLVRSALLCSVRMLAIYEEVRFRPGHSGALAAQHEFENQRRESDSALYSAPFSTPLRPSRPASSSQPSSELPSPPASESESGTPRYRLVPAKADNTSAQDLRRTHGFFEPGDFGTPVTATLTTAECHDANTVHLANPHRDDHAGKVSDLLPRDDSVTHGYLARRKSDPALQGDRVETQGGGEFPQPDLPAVASRLFGSPTARASPKVRAILNTARLSLEEHELREPICTILIWISDALRRHCYTPDMRSKLFAALKKLCPLTLSDMHALYEHIAMQLECLIADDADVLGLLHHHVDVMHKGNCWPAPSPEMAHFLDDFPPHQEAGTHDGLLNFSHTYVLCTLGTADGLSHVDRIVGCPFGLERWSEPCRESLPLIMPLCQPKQVSVWVNHLPNPLNPTKHPMRTTKLVWRGIFSPEITRHAGLNLPLLVIGAPNDPPADTAYGESFRSFGLGAPLSTEQLLIQYREHETVEPRSTSPQLHDIAGRAARGKVTQMRNFILKDEGKLEQARVYGEGVYRHYQKTHATLQACVAATEEASEHLVHLGENEYAEARASRSRVRTTPRELRRQEHLEDRTLQQLTQAVEDRHEVLRQENDALATHEDARQENIRASSRWRREAYQENLHSTHGWILKLPCGLSWQWSEYSTDDSFRGPHMMPRFQGLPQETLNEQRLQAFQSRPYLRLNKFDKGRLVTFEGDDIHPRTGSNTLPARIRLTTLPDDRPSGETRAALHMPAEIDEFESYLAGQQDALDPTLGLRFQPEYPAHNMCVAARWTSDMASHGRCEVTVADVLFRELASMLLERTYLPNLSDLLAMYAWVSLPVELIVSYRLRILGLVPKERAGWPHAHKCITQFLKTHFPEGADWQPRHTTQAAVLLCTVGENIGHVDHIYGSARHLREIRDDWPESARCIPSTLWRTDRDRPRPMIDLARMRLGAGSGSTPAQPGMGALVEEGEEVGTEEGEEEGEEEYEKYYEEEEYSGEDDGGKDEEEIPVPSSPITSYRGLIIKRDSAVREALRLALADRDVTLVNMLELAIHDMLSNYTYTQLWMYTRQTGGDTQDALNLLFAVRQAIGRAADKQQPEVLEALRVDAFREAMPYPEGEVPATPPAYLTLSNTPQYGWAPAGNSRGTELPGDMPQPTPPPEALAPTASAGSSTPGGRSTQRGEASGTESRAQQSRTPWPPEMRQPQLSTGDERESLVDDEVRRQLALGRRPASPNQVPPRHPHSSQTTPRQPRKEVRESDTFREKIVAPIMPPAAEEARETPAEEARQIAADDKRAAKLRGSRERGAAALAREAAHRETRALHLEAPYEQRLTHYEEARARLGLPAEPPSAPRTAKADAFGAAIAKGPATTARKQRMSNKPSSLTGSFGRYGPRPAEDPPSTGLASSFDAASVGNPRPETLGLAGRHQHVHSEPPPSRKTTLDGSPMDMTLHPLLREGGGPTPRTLPFEPPSTKESILVLTLATISLDAASGVIEIVGKPMRNLTMKVCHTPDAVRALAQSRVFTVDFDEDIPQLRANLRSQIATTMGLAPPANIPGFGLNRSYFIILSSIAMLPEEWPPYFGYEPGDPEAPTHYLVARIHGGTTLDILNEDPDSYDSLSLPAANRIARRLMEKQAPPDTRTNEVPRCPATSVHHVLRRGYVAQEHEKDLIRTLLHLLRARPSAVDEGVEFASSMPQSERHHGGYSTSYHRKFPLKEALSVQLKQVCTSFTGWADNTAIQLWNLNIVNGFTHGTMRSLLPGLMEHGPAIVFDSLRVILVETAAAKSMSINDAYANPHNQLILEQAAHDKSKEMEAFLTLYSVEDNLAQASALFHILLAELLAVARGIPYYYDVQALTTREVRRLCSLRRPHGLTDHQWWTSVIRRYQNWRRLMGERQWRNLAYELREFIPLMAEQLVDLSMRQSLCTLGEEYLDALAKSRGLTAAHELPKARSERLGNAIRLPGVSGSHAIFVKVIGTPSDLARMYDIGDALLTKANDGSSITMAAELISYFLEASARQLLNQSQSALMSVGGQGDDSSLLQVNDATETLLNDVMFTAASFPSLNDGCYARSQGLPPTHGLGKPETQLALPESSPKQQPWETAIAELKETIAADRQHNNQELAHLSELTRRQIDNSAHPEMKHAVPSKHATIAEVQDSPPERSKVTIRTETRPPRSAVRQPPRRQPPQLPPEARHDDLLQYDEGPLCEESEEQDYDRDQMAFADNTRHESQPVADRLRADARQRNLGNRRPPPQFRDQRGQNPRPRPSGAGQQPGRPWTPRTQQGAPQRRAGEPEWMYKDKPATSWGEMDQAARDKVTEKTGIKDEEGWKKNEFLPCPFHQPDRRGRHHWLSRCLFIFLQCDRGRQFAGVEDAARRVREHYETISLADCVRSYEAVTSDEERDVVAYAINFIFDSSPMLMAVREDADAMEEPNTAAVQEFEIAAERLLEQCRDADSQLLLR
ncbi:hypothetical protein OAO87_00005 [bacterium]|nr:hypothetical protein [bacterium]